MLTVTMTLDALLSVPSDFGIWLDAQTRIAPTEAATRS